ncbi:MULTISPECIES: DNA-binding protein [Rhodopirellula]|uniref:DNA-binding protein n=1 Tax=Rhodopirellula TaxID=265488 RepID=UPI00257D254B|nr:DNA-binding protein [Rhodopirellula sp. UBA1907]
MSPAKKKSGQSTKAAKKTSPKQTATKPKAVKKATKIKAAPATAATKSKPVKKATKKKPAAKRSPAQIRTDAQLAAGGMVHVNSKVDANATEKVVARRYTGAALGDQVVVRLSADRLGPAEDLAMEYLGLQPDGESKPIALRSRQAMGFASWALLTHPESAKDALALVKRIKAAARKAKSKPGHAMDSFVEMAGELNRSVRHFLPPFWEEAARIYKDLGNTTYAGRAIGKALEAERVHALDVDPHRRRDAVLEFTLSGCLSGKALSEYTRDLANQFAPEEAFETLMDLMVRRTMGGMPPMATAAKDLAKFAKSAGKDADEEVDSFLENVISSPAMSRASMQFWKSVKKNVARLVAADDAFGVWLLAHTDPQASYQGDSPVWEWLNLLDEWKVLPLLGKPASELPADVEIPGGRAGWIGRLASVETSPQPRLFDLISLTADVIRDEAEPIPLIGRGYYGGVLDADALELMLELKLPIGQVLDHRPISFEGWLRAEVDHERRNSQLKHLIADERFGPKVYSAFPELVTFTGSVRERRSYGRTLADQRSFEQAAANHEAVRELWWRFLDNHLQKLEQGGLYDAEVSLNTLVRCAGATTGQQFPELEKRLKKIDMVAVLQRTLAAGVLDEFGWPALDAFGDEQALPKNSRRQVVVDTSFPFVTLLVNGKVESIGPSGQQTLGELQLGKDQYVQLIIPVGNDAVIGLQDNSAGYEHQIAWLSEGGKGKKTDQYFYGFDIEKLLPHDGGVFYGSRVLMPGDQSLPSSEHWFSDGERFWTLKNRYHVWNEFDTSNDAASKPTASLQEIDPVTGKPLRDSIPPWFEDQSSHGGMVNWQMSHWMPAPPGITQSPLGVADGMLGFCVVQRRDQRYESRGMDGREIVLNSPPMQDGGMTFATAIIDKPATDSLWYVSNREELIDADSGMKIANLSGNVTRYCEGQPMKLPTLFYHFYQVRCVGSSAKLRKISLKQAKQLFEAGAIEHEALKTKADPTNPDPNREAGAVAVQKFLSKAPPRLVKGIARISRIAAVEKVSLDKLISKVDGTADEAKRVKKSANTQTAAEWLNDPAVKNGLTELQIPLDSIQVPTSSYGAHRNTLSPEQLIAATKFFTGGEVERQPRGNGVYFGLIDDAASAAWKAFWDNAHRGADDGVPPKQRIAGPYQNALQFVSDCGILDLPGKMVVHVAEAPDEAVAKRLAKAGKGVNDDRAVAYVEGKTRHLAYKVDSYLANKVVVLSYSESGEPKPPKSYAIIDSAPLRKRWSGKSIRHFLEAVAKVDTLPLVSTEKLADAAQKLGVSPIEVALGWMANFRTVHYGQEKLTKELRAHYGWKVNEIKTAVTAADADPVPLSVLANGCRRDCVGALGKNIDRCFDFMVEAWKETQKASVQLPTKVIGQLQSLRGGYFRFDMKLFSELLADPSNSPVLMTRDLEFGYSKQRHREVLEGSLHPPLTFSLSEVLPILPAAIRFLNYSLPHGDPARTKIPGLIDAVRDYLLNPKTTLPMGCSRTEPYSADQETDVEGTIETFSTMIAKCQPAADGFQTFDSGLVVGAVMPPAVDLWFRPAQLQNESDAGALHVAAALTFDWETDGTQQLHFAEFTRLMRSEEMTCIADHNRQTTLTVGAWEQDPRVSSPETVKIAAKKCKLSEDAATLYLQLLALPDCTAANIKSWNDWTTARFKKAAEQLVDGQHLVSAKRSRAGRDVFLPGGWESLKLPNLPIETWKLPLFGYTNSDRLRGGYASLIVCPRTLPDQYAKAWQRIEEGDTPKYEEEMPG